MVDNEYTGRLLTTLSIFDKSYESEYGTQTGHIEEIKDGWNNVKKSIFFGYTPFGHELMEREETAAWQGGLFIHNAYLAVWIKYGLIGLILFVIFYFMSLQLGYSIFIKFNNNTGLIIITFLICQMLKNIVWPTAITLYNVTIIYIFLISIGIKLKQLEKERLNYSE
jgi:O-antigen ligase